MPAMASTRHPWYRDLQAYLDRRMLVILLLGFSSGLPFALSFSTLSVWLREVGVSRTEIGLFALVNSPYSWKFLWAPLLDRVPVPWLTRTLGQRRSWAVITQLCLGVAIIWLGSLDPSTELAMMAIAALAVTFFAASQDIVVDAYRIEILGDHEQGPGSAMIQYGYRIGMLSTGAGALFLSEWLEWSQVYLAAAATLGVGLVTILVVREPAEQPRKVENAPSADQPSRPWLREVLVEPFADFARRPAWVVIMIFVLLYRFPDSFVAAMSNVFYIDLGFSNAEIATVSKTFGLVATLIGVFIGGLIVVRLGTMRGLLVCGIVQVFSNLMYVAMAFAGHDVGVFAATIAIENVSGGMGSAAFVAYLSGLCSPGFAGAQYALLSALGTSGRNLFSSFTGFLADRVEWATFFLVSTAVGLPALLLLLWIDRSGTDVGGRGTGSGESGEGVGETAHVSSAS